MTDHALSPLDQAHAHRLDGNEEAALRLALACARVDVEGPGPVALIARILVDHDHELPALQIAQRLVSAFVRRGDLPGAVVASTIALDAGEPQKPLLAAIARAFAKNAAQATTGSIKPPPIPQQPETGDLDKLEGNALAAEARKVVDAYVAAKDPVD
jgi:hypothetical protein